MDKIIKSSSEIISFWFYFWSKIVLHLEGHLIKLLFCCHTFNSFRTECSAISTPTLSSKDPIKFFVPILIFIGISSGKGSFFFFNIFFHWFFNKHFFHCFFFCFFNVFLICVINLFEIVWKSLIISFVIIHICFFIEMCEIVGIFSVFWGFLWVR